MSWLELFQKPDLPHPVAVRDWFDCIAGRLLNASRLLVTGEPHRLAEIEFYYHGPGHWDPFTHREAIQQQCGRWYFHRTAGQYRSGSFKGLDLAFGDGSAYGGILIRSLETPEGTLINGPSLCVDDLLRQTATGTVKQLDQQIGDGLAWVEDNPLQLVEHDETEHPIYQTARVGLTFRKAGLNPVSEFYMMQPYRYLTEPARIKKGKPHLIVGLHQQGQTPEQIRTLTGSPTRSIQSALAQYAIGQAKEDFSDYAGKNFGTADLCQLAGTWQRHCADREEP